MILYWQLSVIIIIDLKNGSKQKENKWIETKNWMD